MALTEKGQPLRLGMKRPPHHATYVSLYLAHWRNSGSVITSETPPTQPKLLVGEVLAVIDHTATVSAVL